MHVFLNCTRDVGIWVQLVGEETLLEEKISTGRKWDLNPGPLLKAAQPLLQACLTIAPPIHHCGYLFG